MFIDNVILLIDMNINCLDASCDVMTASMCLNNYAASNIFPAFYPINEREMTCR